MKSTFWASIALMYVLPSVSYSNSLSVSEVAARTQRPVTLAEKQLKRRECAWTNASGTQEISPVAGVVGYAVTLADLQIIKLGQMRRAKSGDEGFAIDAFPLLPNGGIAGKDFCAAVEFFPFERPDTVGSVIAGFGLVLRSGLDLARDYPNTSIAIDAGDHLAVSRAGTYVIFDLSKPETAAWWSSQGAIWSMRRQDELAFKLDQRLFYPVNVK